MEPVYTTLPPYPEVIRPVKSLSVSTHLPYIVGMKWRAAR